MRSINERLSATVQTRMTVTLVFLGFCVLLIILKKICNTDTPLLIAIIEKAGLVVVLFVGGKSVTDAVRAYRNGCDDGGKPNGEQK